MAHRVKVMDGSTFRLNPSVTLPYNADFDGDEMNLHVPQSMAARAEAQELMIVHKNIIAPQRNFPMLGIVQDTLLGVHKMTKRSTFMDKDLTMHLLMQASSWDSKVPPPAIMLPDKTTVNIVDSITNAKIQVQDLVVTGQKGKLELQPGRTMIQTFEQFVNKVLNSARDQSGREAQGNLDETNNIKATVTSGSKGSYLNISQIIACVGQQNVEGKRIPYGFHHRTLPHYGKDDLGPESRGFVENSYMKGLTPQEFFFHAMGGREGLIDTAVKTAETGYIQRRLVKAMESVMARYDGTVRDSNGEIIQFLYGEDGMDAVWVEKQNFDGHTLNRAKFEAKFKIDPYDDALGTVPHCPDELYMDPQIIQDIQTNPVTQQLLREEYLQLQKDRLNLRVILASRGQGQESDHAAQVPVNVKRLIQNAQQLFSISMLHPTTLHPEHVINGVRELCGDIIVVKGDDHLSVEAQENATLLFQILLRSTLAVKRMLLEYRLNNSAFEWLLGEIKSKFLASLVPAGEMVGVIAAQSMRAKAIQTMLEYTTLMDVTANTAIYYDPDPTSTVVEEDVDFVASYYDVIDEDTPLARSPWLLRIELHRKMMADKNLEMKEIALQIEHEYGQDLSCIYTDDNADKLVLRIRIMSDEEEKLHESVDAIIDESVSFLKHVEHNMLTQMRLRGVPNVKKVFMRENPQNQWDEEKGFVMVKEWVLDTDGTNLLDVICFDSVDATRTISNDIVEIIEVLGIEAVRRALLNEIRSAISFDGAYVNYRHLACLADVMTFRGHLMAVTRHGINRVDSGPLVRCSFEETVEILMDAAMFSQGDDLAGVTENIMLGQLAQLGTGVMDLILDARKLNSCKFELV
ncbi:unnamed protein product [Aphanomyces euteiches]